uniref:Uncharacterized protein n=1 Tax=Brassica campestris TaxID=3711 RepID=A0A3P5ZH60_BRACM|nr:unnamed protein product [Brassica rapa]
MNETPSSPIAPKSIETPVYTPSQTQQIEREPSDDRLPLILKFLLLI